MSRFTAVIVAGMLAISPLSNAAQAQTPTPIPLPSGEDAVVVAVVDGDTIDVTIGGQPFTVRYIGIDTPETKDPGAPVQCYGPEASAANATLVTGQTLRLEKDRSNVDRYKRLLRYVYLPDGRMVNAELVRTGAAFAKRYPPDTKRAAQLAQAMAAAQSAGAGLWSACQVNLKGLQTLPLPVAVAPAPVATASSSGASASAISGIAQGVPPSDEWTCPPSHPIKGNANSMIYHSPGQQAYNKTKPEVCFAAGADAVAAGYRAAKR